MHEKLDKLRLDAGLARTADDRAIVCVSREGKMIDPLIGLEEYGKLVARECMHQTMRCTIRHGDSEHNRALTEAYEEIKKCFGIE